MEEKSRNFIEQFIDQDLAEGVYDRVQTRFPPEPNGYLHIGHAKSILLNYGIAKEYGGKFSLRFDDTNPTKEKNEFVESIERDVRWLGADFEDRLFFASDYFDKMYEVALILIKQGKAYVSDLTADEIREYRGTLTEPGRNDPNRDRSVEENLDLFTRMRDGEFADGEKTLRARIDMASPNINMRDPILYRVAHRRQVVHLSDVRFRPSAGGCLRGSDTLALHPGVRGSPAALRLGRPRAGNLPESPPSD